MSFRSTSESWEYLAQRDPLWAINSTPEGRGGKWDTSRFFATGLDQIDRSFAYLERRGCLPGRFETALDFGCGVGRLSRALASRFRRVIAVDVSPTMLALGRELNAETPQIAFTLNQNPDLRVIESASISFAYSYVVLQHIPPRESLTYISEIMRVLEPEGVAMFQVPTRDRSSLARRLARGTIRLFVQRLQLPFDEFHQEMHVVPFESIAAAATANGCDLLARFDDDQEKIAADGSLTRTSIPRRLTSEMFVYRKHAGGKGLADG